MPSLPLTVILMDMARLRRRWRVAKRAGILGASLVLLGWVLSIYFDCIYVPGWNMIRSVVLSGGRVHVQRDVEAYSNSAHVPSSWAGGTGLRFQAHDDYLSWWPYVTRIPSGRVCWVGVPLWMILLLIALPAALLCWLDRRIPPHCCRGCGYDLTGNTSGTCPECGRNVEAQNGLAAEGAQATEKN